MSYIMSTDDITKALYNMNKTYDGRQTWKEAFSVIDKSELVDTNALSYDYADAISSAYATNLKNKEASPYLFANDDVNDLNLMNAFDEYRKQYLSNKDTISGTYDESRAKLTDELETTAKNHERYRQAHYAYLQSLAEDNPSLYDNLDFAQYFTTDANGQRVLKGADMLFAPGGYTDAQGNLTALGKDFYKHMSTLGTEGYVPYSMQDFMANNKEYSDLIDWLMSESADAGSTNRDVFYRDILGIGLDDLKYTSASQEKYDEYLREGLISTERHDDIMSNIYATEGTANSVDYTIKRLGDGDKDKDRFKVTIGDKSYKLKAEGDVTDESIVKQLNRLATGSTDTSPKNYDDGKNPLVVYKNTMYVYTDKGWKSVVDRKDNVADAVATYLSNGKYDFNKRNEYGKQSKRVGTTHIPNPYPYSLGVK